MSKKILMAAGKSSAFDYKRENFAPLQKMRIAITGDKIISDLLTSFSHHWTRIENIKVIIESLQKSKGDALDLSKANLTGNIKLGKTPSAHVAGNSSGSSYLSGSIIDKKFRAGLAASYDSYFLSRKDLGQKLILVRDLPTWDRSSSRVTRVTDGGHGDDALDLKGEFLLGELDGAYYVSRVNPNVLQKLDRNGLLDLLKRSVKVPNMQSLKFSKLSGTDQFKDKPKYTVEQCLVDLNKEASDLKLFLDGLKN